MQFKLFIKHPFTWEFSLFILCFAVWFLVVGTGFFSGNFTVIHDNLNWSYPVYHFWAEQLLQGELPLWNPFSHAGEPFYPMIIHFRLLDPLALLTLKIGSAFTKNLLYLFHLHLIVGIFFHTSTVYFLFRSMATPWVRLTLIPLLCFSSLTIAPLRQDGMLNTFSWCPLILLLSFRIIEKLDQRFFVWAFLGGITGLCFQSYWFAGPAVLLLLLLAGYWFCRRYRLKALWKKPIGWQLTLSVCIAALMAMPNLVLFLERNHFVFQARHVGGTDKEAIAMSYKHIQGSGASGNIWNLIQLPVGDANIFIHKAGEQAWGRPSEGYLFLGFIPWLLALWGVFLGRHPLKKVWLVLLLGMILFYLGPEGGLHPILYFIFPLVQFIRNTHTFAPFVMMCLLYFYVLGANRLMEGGRSC